MLATTKREYCVLMHINLRSIELGNITGPRLPSLIHWGSWRDADLDQRLYPQSARAKRRP